jgi:two-component system, LuxR family, response regulator FixJ
MASRSVIYIAEDDQPLRHSLVELLEEAGYDVYAYATAEELFERTAGAAHGCVISDVRMPGIDGLTLLRRLRAKGSPLPLILITGHGDVSMAVTAMKAGAADFLEKPFEAGALLAAVEAALRLRSPSTDATDAEAARQRLAKLTSREQEVLEHLVAGKSNKEIAAKLAISPRTIEFHRAHLMEKTGANGLPDLVRLWLAVQTFSNGQASASSPS